jgi:hypothetical protein
MSASEPEQLIVADANDLAKLAAALQGFQHRLQHVAVVAEFAAATCESNAAEHVLYMLAPHGKEKYWLLQPHQPRSDIGKRLGFPQREYVEPRRLMPWEVERARLKATSA